MIKFQKFYKSNDAEGYTEKILWTNVAFLSDIEKIEQTFDNRGTKEVTCGEILIGFFKHFAYDYISNKHVM